MNFSDIKIDLRTCNRWFQKRFPNKDVISFEELLGDYEDLIDEVEELYDQIKHLEEDQDSEYDYTDYVNDRLCD